jgi:hypothetical protein
MKKFATKLFLSVILFQVPLTAETAISMFPPDAIELDDNYRDWYGPELEQLAEKPLWPDTGAAQEKEIVRFLFIPGAARVKGRHSSVIRIEIADGMARLITRAKFNHFGRRSIRTLTTKNLSIGQIAKLRELANQAEAWKFRVGSWDKHDPESVYIHCTELIMERQTRSDYAVSRALISCNQPNRLMPFVNYIAELAEQKHEDLRY